jgi:hypothetical protein
MDAYWYYSAFTLFMLIVFECTVVGQRQRTLTDMRAISVPKHHVEVCHIPLLRMFCMAHGICQSAGVVACTPMHHLPQQLHFCCHRGREETTATFQ